MSGTLILGLEIQKLICGEKESFLEARAAAAGQHIGQSDSGTDVPSQPFTSGQREANAATKAFSFLTAHIEGKSQRFWWSFPSQEVFFLDHWLSGSRVITN